ncbi:MAG TPA: diguanylate cyclase [Patescibacteria group bacterium]|nr:diguanylate cyclase [Patescibacteria group bacterium]
MDRNADREFLRKSRGDLGYLVILFGVLLIGVGLFSTLHQINYEQAEEMLRITREGSNISKALQEHVHRVFKNVDRVLMTKREIYSIPSQNDLLEKLLSQYFYQEALFVQAGIMDAAGAVTPTHGHVFPVRVLEGENFTVHQTDDEDRMYVSRPLPESRYLVLSRRIFGPDGRFGGIVYAVIRPDIITDIYWKMELGEDKLMVLTGEDGIIRARQDQRLFSNGQDISASPLISVAQRQPSGSVKSISLVDGIERTQYFRTVPEYSLVVSVGISERDFWIAYQYHKVLYWGVFLLFSLMISAFCGLLFWRARAQERLQDKVVKNARQLSALHVTTRHLVRNYASEEELFGIIVRDACQLVGAPDGSVELLDDNGEFLTVCYGLGLYQQFTGTQIPRELVAQKEGIWSQVQATGGPVYIDDYRRYPQRIQHESLAAITTMIVYPLKRQERVLGIFVVSWTEEVVSLTPNEQKLLAQYSVLASVALDNVSTNRRLRIANEELERLASTDRLTGAWNRRRFEELAAVAVAESVRYKQPLAFLMLDVDHFKAINDRFGHPAGDAVLKELVQMIQRHIRISDSLARWGGEEFVLILPHTAQEQAAKLAEKLRCLIERHKFPEVEQVTISMGLTERKDGDTWEAMLQRSDEALYDAKDQGRNRVVCWEKAAGSANDMEKNA